MKRTIGMLTFIGMILPVLIFGQQTEYRDTAVFIEKKNEFYDSIQTTLAKFSQKEKQVKKELSLDFSRFHPPVSIGEFTSAWHTPPVSQAVSGMCWCFSTTSFLESEIYRTTKRKIKLSELYTVYWEYVEKARGFVRTRGNQEFGEGSQSNAVFRAWKNYGIVPADAYTGLLNNQPFHDHSKLFSELDAYLKSLRQSNAWDEETVLRTVKSILNHALGVPPEKITVQGTSMTPKEYLTKILRLNLDEYIELVSFSDRPFDQWCEYDVPDNWWHSKEYFNIPLDEFMAVVQSVVRSGSTAVIGGDVSEPGLYGHAGIAVVPSFDIPPEYIDASARIFRYKNGTSGDDHGIHIVGSMEKNGTTWYLIKDSGSGSRNNSHPGYYFYHEDYIKLKMLTLLVHADFIPEIMKRIKK